MRKKEPFIPQKSLQERALYFNKRVYQNDPWTSAKEPYIFAKEWNGGRDLAVIQVTCINEACHMYEWVMSQVRDMSHVWMRHVTHMNEPCYMYEWAMSHVWMSHVTCMHEACHMYEWVMSQVRDMSHVWRSHATCMNELDHTYEWAMSHVWMSNLTCMHEPCHDMTHSYVWHGSWIIHVWHDSWLIHMCDMTHDSFRCVTWRIWLIHMCDMTHTYEQGMSQV